MFRKLVTLILIATTVLLVACGDNGNNAEPAAAPAEGQPESQPTDSGAAGSTDEAQTTTTSGAGPKFIEFYADW